MKKTKHNDAQMKMGEYRKKLFFCIELALTIGAITKSQHLIDDALIREQVAKGEPKMNTVERDFVQTGKELIIVEQTVKKIQKGMTPDKIANELETDLTTIQKICDMAKNFAPDYDADIILEKLRGRPTRYFS